MPVIQIKNVSKRFGTKSILSAINFSLNRGEAVGILGPNGAGKTTLLKTICGLVKPTDGEVILNGLSPDEIATIFEDQRFLGHLSGIKNMRVFLNSIDQRLISLEKHFEQFGLAQSKHVKYKVYSSGMKKRMDLMSIFAPKKQLFLLDEPTNGLDIDGMIAFNQHVISIKNEGKSFVIASHHTLELEKICDSFLMIHSGAVIAEMSKAEVLQEFNSLETAYRSVVPTSINQKLFQR